MAVFGDRDAIQSVCNAIRMHKCVVEYVSMRGPDKLIEEAYKLEPRIIGSVKGWSSNYAQNGRLGITKTVHLELEYNERYSGTYEDVILDDGKWKPSERLTAMPRTIQIVTTDPDSVRDRFDKDWANMQDRFPALYSFGYTWLEKEYNGYKILWVHYQAYMEDPQLNLMETAAKRELERVARTCLGNGQIPSLIRVYLVFSYLQQTCVFDHETAEQYDRFIQDTEQNPPLSRPWACLSYGPLVKKLGIGVSISAAFHQFMNHYGIENHMVFGGVGEPGQELGQHCWNMVKLDGKNYHVDVTYGIEGDGIYIGKFLKADCDMADTHAWDTDRYPACTSDRMDFDMIEDYITEHHEQLIRAGVDETYLYPADIRE